MSERLHDARTGKRWILAACRVAFGGDPQKELKRHDRCLVPSRRLSAAGLFSTCRCLSSVEAPISARFGSSTRRGGRWEKKNDRTGNNRSAGTRPGAGRAAAARTVEPC